MKELTFSKTYWIGHTRITIDKRSRSTTGWGQYGRFGGGWNWSLGFQLGRRNLAINLLVMSVWITWKCSFPRSIK